MEVNRQSSGLRSGECVKVFFPAIVKSNVDGVCMEARTDSPATPLPKDHNCLNHQQPFLMKVVGISKGRRHMGIFPLGPKV